MKAWPRFRESLFTLWHKILDYDRKIPPAKRQETQMKRETAKAMRLKRDRADATRAAVISVNAHERKSRRDALAELERAEVEILPPPIPSQQRRDSVQPYNPVQQQQPQVIYVQQPGQTVVVKSMGCADGCVIVIAVIIILALLPVGCAVVGIGSAGGAREDVVKRQEAGKNHLEGIDGDFPQLPE